MEVHQLRYFVAVAQEASFSRAAAKVRVAQPSLSQQIQKLETTLGRRLFDRLARRVVLTEAGSELLPFAQRILNDIHSAERALVDRDAAPAGPVRLGVLPTIAPFITRELLRRVREQVPEVEVTLVEDVTAQLVHLVDNGEVDLAVISTCRASPGLDLEPWAREELLAALPERHVLARRKTLSWRDLHKETVLLGHESHCLSGQVQTWCAQHRTRHRRAGVLQLGTLLEMIAANSGISLVPRMATAFPARGVVFRPLADDIPEREINVVRNASRYQSKAARMVAEIGRTALLQVLRSPG